ncbi:hypothetical protein CLV41_109209 [Roseibium marinum]|uniref:Uncharacterized protein n=2 Tax=Roseibium marinum TaxID=281252 RepID=A0A2S3UPG8_9HYPH|nr:hypothetical protein CLV41_109209 [Roseibium marinum]
MNYFERFKALRCVLLLSLLLFFQDISAYGAPMDTEILDKIERRDKKLNPFVADVSEVILEHIDIQKPIEPQLEEIGLKRIMLNSKDPVILKKYNATDYQYYEGRKYRNFFVSYWELTVLVLNIQSNKISIVALVRQRGL